MKGLVETLSDIPLNKVKVLYSTYLYKNDVRTYSKYKIKSMFIRWNLSDVIKIDENYNPIKISIMLN